MCIERWRPNRREVMIGGSIALSATSLSAQEAGNRQAERLTFPNGGAQVRAKLFRRRSDVALPLILIAHGDPGFPAYLHAFGGRLADEGWAALLVDWTYRMPRPPAAGADREAWLRSVGSYRNWRGDDLEAARQWAVSSRIADAARIAVVGFCGGGVIASHFAANGPPLQGLVLFYTPVRHHGRFHDPGDPRPDVTDIASRIRGPVQAHFGMNDPTALPADGREFEQRLQSLGRRPSFHYYEGAGHGFLQSEMALNAEGTFGFVPAAARLATERAMDFLRKRLGRLGAYRA